MNITWDETKRLSNFEKHGLDFADLTTEFFLTSVVVPAKYQRFAAIGRLDDGTIVVIFARRGREAISVISMRAASVKERKMLR